MVFFPLSFAWAQMMLRRFLWIDSNTQRSVNQRNSNSKLFLTISLLYFNTISACISKKEKKNNSPSFICVIAQRKWVLCSLSSYSLFLDRQKIFKASLFVSWSMAREQHTQSPRIALSGSSFVHRMHVSEEDGLNTRYTEKATLIPVDNLQNIVIETSYHTSALQ